jgi:aminoglycoside/choline kinase family phosphotransferase
MRRAAARGEPVTEHLIPESPEQVSNEWLTSALRQDGAISRAAVTAHTGELVEMQGAAAVVARLELDYDLAEAGAPRSVVAKFATPHEPIRALMHGFGGYRREVEFYRQFGPEPGIPIPHCLHADIDLASGMFVLLLEDMSDSRVPDMAAPSVDDVEVAVRHLAPFHARWWNHPRLRELEFLRYPGSPANEVFLAQGRAAFEMALPAAREQFGSEFPATLVTVAEYLLANFDTVLETRQQDQGSTTLVHGDYHPGQLFYESERGGRFAVFDWQTVGAGSGGDDLARIIVTGLTSEQREASDGRLIELYHSLLVEHGVTGYDIERCRDDFRLGLLTTLVINTIAAPNIDPALIEEAEERAEISAGEALFVRLAAAVDAHDVLEVIPT